MAVIVGVVSSVIHWCTGMHPPTQPRAIATMWGRESKKVGEGQQEGGIKTRVLKVEVGGLG